MYRSIRSVKRRLLHTESGDWLTRDSTSGPFRVVLGRLACFRAVQIAAVLQMARMRGHGYIGHTEEMPGDQFSHLKTVEVLKLHFGQNPPQRALDLRCTERSEEHRLDFCSHKKEVPSSSAYLAIKRGCIRHFNRAPPLKKRFGFNSNELRHSRPLSHQNRADFNGGWHQWSP